SKSRERGPDRSCDMPLTSFVSATHGFRFDNAGNSWFQVGTYTKKGPLCGGMVYLAYDYFHNNVTIPADTTQPALGTALSGRLLGRQTTAHANTVPKFIEAWTWPKPWERQAVEMTQLVSAISSSRKPQVICFFGSFVGHHVLVTDVKMPNLTEGSTLWEITTYDPNFKNQQSTFIYKSNCWERNGGGYGVGQWKGFFRDTGFKPISAAASSTLNTPTSSPIGSPASGPTTQSGWNWCSKCQGLFFSAAGSRCPAGAAHSGAGSGNYTLTQNGGMGQPNWRYCSKCHGLYFKGSATGLCPAGGPHDASQSGDYRLEQSSGKGQGGWRYCKKCAALFFGGAGTMGSVGKCPASGVGHDGTGSGDYWLVTG
ncbi:MAG: hypothetical protein ACREXY_11325, partial [Gammaproteobacteria bacterium]